MQIELKYGCNPHQKPAYLHLPASAPLQILNGMPGYINMLDALGAWQLVRELHAATDTPAAASFKHTSPAGAAIARPLTDTFRRSQFLSAEALSPVATAYARARGGDRVSSFGDVVAVSAPVDVSLANLLRREVSDLIIAPAYEPEALAILRRKKQGGYLILQMDPDYTPPAMEQRELFGFILQQARNQVQVAREHFRTVLTGPAVIPDDIMETLIVATVALKYTQSNSICVAYDGQVIGMGAGQQSRIHCTRLACDKADKWLLQQHPKVLRLPFRSGLGKPDKANLVDQYLLWEQLSEPEMSAMLEQFTATPEPLSRVECQEWLQQFAGICLSSDAFIPFRDNVDRASRSHVQYVAETGGSVRTEEVKAAAEQHGMTLIHTGLRCFLH
jgi:AICAR transformylase/IMP cyclohydrolase PurH